MSLRSCRAVEDSVVLFIFENADGVNHKAQGQLTSPLHSSMELWRKKVGQAWPSQALRLSALDFGLPQRRPRVYLVGRQSTHY